MHRRAVIAGMVFVVGLSSGRAFAERPGYRIAKAVEDRSAALFDDDLDLKTEVNLVIANMDELNQERSSDPDLEAVRRAAIRSVRTSKQTLDAYIDVQARAPGGMKILEDVAKTVEDRREDRDPDSGEVTRHVKGINVARATWTVLEQIAAQRQLSELKTRYWRTCIVDRALIQRMWEFERARSDVERKQLLPAALEAQVNDHFNGAYRGNLLSVHNTSDRVIQGAVVFFVVTCANHPQQSYWYMITADRLAPGDWTSIQIDSPDGGTQGGRIETMRAHVFGDHERGISDVSYGRAERDADIRRYLQNLQFSGRVVEPSDSWWSGKHPRGFNLKFTGKDVPPRLNPKAVIVTFRRNDGAQAAVSFTIQNWKKDDDQDFRSADFSFVPDRIDVQLEFYDSDYAPSATWK